jgi:hypothetical protein
MQAAPSDRATFIGSGTAGNLITYTTNTSLVSTPPIIAKAGGGKVYLDYIKPFQNYYSYIPYRRNSKLLKLKHEDCGYSDGRWKDDNSRWNQLRFNNEVQTGHRDDIEDGLTTLKYHKYGIESNGNIKIINVGI